jgi:hypothetical protein
VAQNNLGNAPFNNTKQIVKIMLAGDPFRDSRESRDGNQLLLV